MGELTVALFAWATLIALALVALGAIGRRRILLAIGSALLIGIAGTWTIGLPGAALGLAALVVLVVRSRR